tara:strand:- start:203 stop:505 length:303 start_codon:yes stop_codon:yes gene_type:complete
MLYIKLLLIFFVIPSIIISIYLWKKKAFETKPLILSTLIFAIFAIPLDIYATSKGVWSFGEDHVLGFWLFGLPLEEYLFYITVIPLVFLIFKLISYHLKE